MPKDPVQRTTRKNMAHRPTLVDISDLAGVSKATVSNVMNDKPGVGPELRDKIKDIIKRTGYVPKAAARHLSLSRSNTLALVMQDLTPGWLLTIFRGVLKGAGTKFHVITSLSIQEGDANELPTRVLANASIDGLVWCDPRVTPDLIKKFQLQGLPFVLIQIHNDFEDVTSVAIHHTKGAYTMTKYLLNLGYRRIMLITGQEDNLDSTQKMEGVMQALREFNVAIPPDYILNGHHVDWYAIQAMNEFEASGKPMPEAIFAFNDHMALAILKWLRDRGFRVPEDVALVGYDGIEDSKAAELTTVENPIFEMGKMATQLLIDLIETPTEERKGQHVFMEGTLRVRKTCGAALRIKD